MPATSPREVRDTTTPHDIDEGYCKKDFRPSSSASSIA